MHGFVVCQLELALWAKNSNHHHFAVYTGSMGVACPLVTTRLDKPGLSDLYVKLEKKPRV